MKELIETFDIFELFDGTEETATKVNSQLREMSANDKFLKVLIPVLIHESLLNFYRNYYDSNGEDITIQIARFVRETTRDL